MSRPLRSFLIGLLCLVTLVPGVLLISLAGYTYLQHGPTPAAITFGILGLVLSFALIPDIYRAAYRRSLLGLAFGGGATWAAFGSMCTFLAGQESAATSSRILLHLCAIGLLSLAFWSGAWADRAVSPNKGG